MRSNRTSADADRHTRLTADRRRFLLAATGIAWTSGLQGSTQAAATVTASHPGNSSAPGCNDDGLTEIRHFACGDQSLVDRIAQIDSASRSIELAYYSIDSGIAAMAILESLRLASTRGVSVRLLIDGFKSRIPDNVIRILQSSGVSIRIFNTPCLARPARLNRRFHGKMLIIDGCRLTTGSRNLEDAHFRLNPFKVFCDQDISLTGPIAGDARRYFDRLWASDRLAPPRFETGDAFDFDLRRLGQREKTRWEKRVESTRTIQGFRCLLDEARERALTSKTRSMAAETSRWVPSNHIRWITDCHLRKACGCFQKLLVSAIDAAETCITLESPYPALAKPTQRALVAAARRGVHVRLCTNSLRSTDQVNVYAAFQNDKRHLSRAGIRIIECSGDATMHAKILLIDGCFSLIGSHNFDERSDRLNLETSVAILDEFVHHDLLHSIQRRYANADAIPGDRGLWQHPEGTDLKRRVGLWLRRGLVPIYRKCL